MKALNLPERTCWNCHVTFKRRGVMSLERRGWGSVLINHIWEQCKVTIPGSPATSWLVDSRKLLNDTTWLIGHDLAVVHN